MEGGRYQVVFGAGWRQAVKNHLDKEWCNVADMILHLYNEGNRLFAGTPCVHPHRSFSVSLVNIYDS